MRVAVIDIGTNSTRLLVADVEGSKVSELTRRSTVTRLGRGVDTSGQLSSEAIEDVCGTVAGYIAIYEPLEPDVVTSIATSAVRDAENSGSFLPGLGEPFALHTRLLEGSEEAKLTYLGACAGRPAVDGTLVIDIGGGSTELVLGSASQVVFYPSLPAIEQELDPYDPELVHGYKLSLDSVQRMLAMLSSKTLEERLEVPGHHPGRAPTIVAGVVILIQVMRAFGLEQVEVSEHDILHGAALEAVHAPA